MQNAIWILEQKIKDFKKPITYFKTTIKQNEANTSSLLTLNTANTKIFTFPQAQYSGFCLNLFKVKLQSHLGPTSLLINKDLQPAVRNL